MNISWIFPDVTVLGHFQLLYFAHIFGEVQKLCSLLKTQDEL